MHWTNVCSNLMFTFVCLLICSSPRKLDLRHVVLAELNWPLMIYVLLLIHSLLVWVESVGMRGYHSCDYGIFCYISEGIFTNLINVPSQLTWSSSKDYDLRWVWLNQVSPPWDNEILLLTLKMPAAILWTNKGEKWSLRAKSFS